MNIIIITHENPPIVVEDVSNIDVNGDDVTVWSYDTKEEFNVNDIIEAKLTK